MCVDAQTLTAHSLSLDGARAVVAAVKREASLRKAPGGVVAVVDAGGHLIALERLDGTFAAGAPISIGKARTAALFKKPTRFFEELINKSRTAMTALSDFTPLQGGVPIVVGDTVVGGVGVSGAASAQQDEDLALAGAAAASSTPDAIGTSGTAPPAATYLAQDRVTAAFAKGMPLIETTAYKIHASRREADGQSEVHVRDTDIIYVLEGSATIITGGRAVGAVATAADELRGDSIAGGDARTVTRGDVIVVPRGVPHQFKNVKGPFLYYVVKVTERGNES
jgi:glc operon protein GlcG